VILGITWLAQENKNTEETLKRRTANSTFYGQIHAHNRAKGLLITRTCLMQPRLARTYLGFSAGLLIVGIPLYVVLNDSACTPARLAPLAPAPNSTPELMLVMERSQVAGSERRDALSLSTDCIEEGKAADTG
jgi:hypothetical protein